MRAADFTVLVQVQSSSLLAKLAAPFSCTLGFLGSQVSGRSRVKVHHPTIHTVKS